jgi:hypothetical protein
VTPLRRRSGLVALGIGFLAAGSCVAQYRPGLPTRWSNRVTNPFFPLVPGTTFRYSSRDETVVVEVLDRTRQVQGVTATAVRDRGYSNGVLQEDTEDWFAQDSAGNVWYLGEDSKELEDGRVVGTEGSWTWGENGALPGIIMWADPAAHVGQDYRQEYRKGIAEDWGKVLATDQNVTVGYGSFTGCLETEDWSGIERGGHELKYYCPQIGLVLETSTSGGNRLELTTRTED